MGLTIGGKFGLEYEDSENETNEKITVQVRFLEQ